MFPEKNPRYPITRELSLPGLAKRHRQDLTSSEIRKRDCRVIGGDRGDIEFRGYHLDEDRQLTVLYKPVLVYFGIDELSEDQVFDLASDILMNSFESIGLETVEVP